MSFGPKTIEEARVYKYGAGSWNKTPYIEGRCIAAVWEQGRAPMMHQCNRKAVVGCFCKTHDPEAEKARQKASQDKWDKRMAASRAQWEAPAKLATATHEIARLRAALKQFGAHHQDCIHHYFASHECNCGLDAALKEGE